MHYDDQNPPEGFECWDDEATLEENIILNERLLSATDADFVDGDEVLARLVPEFYA
jgi:hypothetical protein